MSTLFSAESSHWRGFEFEKSRTLEKQGDIGWGIQRREPTQGSHSVEAPKPADSGRAKQALKKLLEEKSNEEPKEPTL